VISDTEVAGELQAATRLTGLRHLELDNADLDPIFLLSWPSLQHLQLSSILLFCEAGGHGGAVAPPAAALPAPAGGGHVNAEAPAVAPAVPEDGIELQQFLQAIQQLTQLQHLHLAEISLEAGPQAVLNQQQFSALVASPQLTSLELAVPDGMPLPLVGLRQLFAPGVRLPALRVLRLRGQTAGQREPQLGTDDLEALAAACPGLQVSKSVPTSMPATSRLDFYSYSNSSSGLPLPS
jgi:hypothetical protein